MTQENNFLKNIVGDLIQPKRNNPFLNSVFLGLSLFCLLITSVVGGFGVNIFIISYNKTQWIYSQFIYFFIVVLFWLASPYIVSRFREKISLIAMAGLFLIICFMRVFATSIMVFPIILYGIGIMVIWTSVGSYMFAITKNITFPGSCFGALFATAGLYRLFYHLDGMATTIATFIIFLIIAVILILLLAKPNNDIEMEHHHIKDFKQSILSPIEVLKSDQSLFSLTISSLIYLGASNYFIDLITYSASAIYFTYSIFFLISVTIFGILYDKFEKKKIIIVIIGLAALASIFTIGANYSSGASATALYYLISILFAIINAAVNVLVYLIISSLYSLDKCLSVASNTIFFIQVGSFFAFIQIAFVPQLFIFFLILMLFTSLLSFLYLFKFNSYFNSIGINNNNNNNNYYNIYNSSNSNNYSTIPQSSSESNDNNENNDNVDNPISI